MKKLYFLNILFFLSSILHAQTTQSIFLSFGPNELSGDIGSDLFTNEFFKNDIGIGTSLGYRFISPINLGASFFGSYNYFRGNDSKKHLHFYDSSTSGIGGQLEYYIIGNKYFALNVPHYLYIFGGGEIVFSNALLDNETKVNDNTSDYFVGGGYQYRFSDELSVGFELKGTLYQSDKIDGYFPDIRANKYKDAAYIFQILLSYYLFSNPFGLLK